MAHEPDVTKLASGEHYRSAAPIIAHGVWLCLRVPASVRLDEDVLLGRGKYA